MFGAIYAAEGTAINVLAEVAREFSPRIEVYGPRGSDQPQAREIVLELSGVARLFGNGRAIAEQLRRTAADRGLRVRVAIAGTCTAARLLVRHRAGLTVIEPGTEASALAPLPISLLGTLSNPPSPDGFGEAGDPNGLLSTFRRWGLRTLGDLAALPPDELASRLGREGTKWQCLSRGEDPHPLVPAVPDERFEQSLDLEWPIEDLEPLSFVLGRLMEPLAAHLERRDRGAAVLHVRLHLIKLDGLAHRVHARSLQLPIPIRDARTLRTLALLDLESHPPPAACDRVTVAIDPTPGRIVQFSLLTRPLPSPERISTLMARLQALVGETRCGSPAVVDAWQPGGFTMKPFNPGLGTRDPGLGTRDSGLGAREPGTPSRPGSRIPDPESRVTTALRRFRHPVPVRVHVEHGKPSSVTTRRRGLSGGVVEACAGPWRTSGGWWGPGIRGSGLGAREPETPSSPGSRIPDPESRIPSPRPWDRDEWDVTLTGGATYRLCRERMADQWFIDGVVD